MIRITFYVGTRPAASVYALRTALTPGNLYYRARRIREVLAETNIGGATILPAIGAWAGELEPSFRVECLIIPDLGMEAARAIAAHAAELLRREFDQDAVYFTLEPVEFHSAARPTLSRTEETRA